MAESKYMHQLSTGLFALQRRQVLCDVTLTADNGKLMAHSAVLAATSDFMCQQFQVLTQTDHRTEYYVQVAGCDVTTLDMVLRLLYTGDVHLQHTGDLHKVLDVCTSLGVNLQSLHNISVTVEADLSLRHPTLQVEDLTVCPANSDNILTGVIKADTMTCSQREMFVVIEQQLPQPSSSAPIPSSSPLPSPPPAVPPAPSSPLSSSHGDGEDSLTNCESVTVLGSHHTCDTCGKHYQSARYLRVHQLSHGGLKPLLCDTCGRGFYGLVNLNRHILLRHRGTTTLRYVCDRCGKGFVAAARLRRHIAEMHDDTTRLRHCCDTCHVTFANAGNLQRHRQIHSTEPRRHVCEVCQRRFTQKTSLHAHYRLHDSEARRQAMCVCPVCGKQLSKSTNLRKHLLHHAPRPLPP